jgi:hypothetical protein
MVCFDTNGLDLNYIFRKEYTFEQKLGDFVVRSSPAI